MAIVVRPELRCIPVSAALSAIEELHRRVQLYSRSQYRAIRGNLPEMLHSQLSSRQVRVQCNGSACCVSI